MFSKWFYIIEIIDINENTYFDYIKRIYYGERFQETDENKIVELCIKNYEQFMKRASKVELEAFSTIIVDWLLDDKRRHLISSSYFDKLVKIPVIVNTIGKDVKINII